MLPLLSGDKGPLTRLRASFAVLYVLGVFLPGRETLSQVDRLDRAKGLIS